MSQPNSHLRRRGSSAGTRASAGAPIPFDPDFPVERDADDRLGRSELASRLASAIASGSNRHGLVVGVLGPWGTGKSSLLNLVARQLEATDCVVIRFNPWFFEEQDSLVRRLFEQLIAQLAASRAPWVTKLVAALKEYELEVSAPLPVIAGISANVSAKRSPRPKDVEELRARVESVVRKAGRLVCVVIDDVDRLDSAQVRSVFRLVKLVGRLRGFTYLMAFDPAVVSHALREDFQDPDAFVEKIVQVAVPMAEPRRSDIRRICSEGVDRVFEACATTLTRAQKDELAYRFQESVLPYLRSLRAAKRMMNSINFLLPLLKDETDPVDVILIEGLRATAPAVYEIVRRNRHAFLHDDISYVFRNKEQDAGKRFNEMLAPGLAGMDEERATRTRDMLAALFPAAAEDIRRPVIVRQGWGPTKDRRVGNARYFDRYFQLGVASDQIPDVEIAEIVKACDRDPTADIQPELERLVARFGTDEVLEAIEATLLAVTPAAARPLLLGLARSSKSMNLHHDDPLASTVVKATRLALHLLRRAAHADRAEVARLFVQAATAIELMVRIAAWAVDPDAKREFDLEIADPAPIKAAVVTRIESLATAGPIFRDDRFWGRAMMNDWAAWGAPGAMQSHVVNSLARDATLVLPLLKCYANGMREIRTESGVQGELALSVEDFAALKATFDLVPLANAIDKAWATGTRPSLASDFLRHFESGGSGETA